MSHGFGIANAIPKKNNNLEFPLGNSNPCDNIGVLGAEPLGERVASNEVRARGRLPPPNSIFFLKFKKVFAKVAIKLDLTIAKKSLI